MARTALSPATPGSRAGPRNLSPFERRLMNYQQTSLQRATPKGATNRSGSRGKRLSREGRDPASQLQNSSGKLITAHNGFYADHTSSSSKLHNLKRSSRGSATNLVEQRGSETQRVNDLKVIRANLEKYLTAYETFSMASRQKDRFENELIKQLDVHLKEQLIFFGQGYDSNAQD